MPRSTLQVLDVGDRLLRRAGAEVHPQQRLGAHQPAPVDEFVGAELVRLERIPRAIENGWPLGLRADAIEPVVARDEVSSWIANDGNAKLADLARDIRAKAARIGHRRAGFINTRVDGPPEVLEEGTEESSIEIAHATDRRDAHACGAPTGLRGSDQFEPGTAREQRTGAAKPTQDAAAINRQDAVQVNAFGIICAPDAIVAAPAVSRAFHVPRRKAHTRRVRGQVRRRPRVREPSEAERHRVEGVHLQKHL